MVMFLEVIVLFLNDQKVTQLHAEHGGKAERVDKKDSDGTSDGALGGATDWSEVPAEEVKNCQGATSCTHTLYHPPTHSQHHINREMFDFDPQNLHPRLWVAHLTVIDEHVTG